MKRVLFALIATLLLVAAAPIPLLEGRSLQDAIRILGERGLRIVYSDEVVRPEMKVLAEPTATDARKALDQILAPHGLAARRGPSDSIVIIRLKQKQSAASGGGMESAVTAQYGVPFDLGEIVVSPSSYAILGDSLDSGQTLSKEDVDKSPHLGDDVFRVVDRMPGMASPDFSAGFFVRGGAEDELQVFIDGLELQSPYHLSEFLKVFGVVDSEAVGGIAMVTGGFPVEYGGRMSGVMNIDLARPSTEPSFAFGTSFVNTRLLTEGSFNEGRGQWLGSLRIGYLDVVVEMLDPDSIYTPRYADLIGRVQYQTSDRTLLAVNALAVRDSLDNGDDEEDIDFSGRDLTLWLNAKTAWSTRVFSESVLSAGQIDRTRRGGVIGEYIVDDVRDFSFVGARQEWTFDTSSRNQLRAGFDARYYEGSYDYQSLGVLYPPDLSGPIVTDLDFTIDESGTGTGIWIADRVQLHPRVILEAGLRWDHQGWIDDDDHFSPRLNVAVQLAPGTIARASWGQYRQAQRIDELDIEDGIVDFFPSQLTETWILGVERWMTPTLLVRLEGYYKDMSSLRPRFENAFDPWEYFPEATLDRYRIDPERGEAKGIELFAKWQGRGPFSAWASYTWSRAEDIIGGERYLRKWDQPHALTFNTNFAKGPWNISLSGTWRTGWPTTSVTGTWERLPDGRIAIYPELGKLNDERFEDYLRFDLRAGRSFHFGAGSLLLYLEVINLTNRENECCVDDFYTDLLPDGTAVITKDLDNFLEVVPSFGIMWRSR